MDEMSAALMELVDEGLIEMGVDADGDIVFTTINKKDNDGKTE